MDQLDNTYIIFTSDNGFQLGNHAQSSGKQFHWEEVVRVPFYIRGAGGRAQRRAADGKG